MTKHETQSLDNQRTAAAPPAAESPPTTPNGASTQSTPSTNASSNHFQGVTDNLDALLDTLPDAIRDALVSASREVDVAADGEAPSSLLEIVLDLGRVPWARYIDREVQLSDAPTTQEQLDTIVSSLGEFGGDNRAGIDGTLHRISC
ncbi:MAG TPA: hypothetical protein QGF05_02090, partial [Dehalococcoidia bacterium]|nr:hypothetical protein [Dehalococcoidia bacterium]